MRAKKSCTDPATPPLSVYSDLSSDDAPYHDGVADLDIYLTPGPSRSARLPAGAQRFIARKRYAHGFFDPVIEVLEVRSFETPPKPVRAESDTALAFKRAVGVHDLRYEHHCAALRAEGWWGELDHLPFPLCRNEWVRHRHTAKLNQANSGAIASWMFGRVTAALEDERDMNACVHAELRIFDLENTAVDIKKLETCVRSARARG